MIFYDSHAHCIGKQAGGILIGLEGTPVLPGFLDNEGVKAAAASAPGFIPCYYVGKEWNEVPDESFLKYHPRREKYSADEVIADLKRRSCKLCIIDTLNQPHWGCQDYWKVVSAFPGIKFILPHMGGYDIQDFLKILDFNRNVFCDFSFTQDYFGWCGSRPRLGYVCDAIDYCLNTPRLAGKVLFGTDVPDFSQDPALEKYAARPDAEAFLAANYKNLINSL